MYQTMAIVILHSTKDIKTFYIIRSMYLRRALISLGNSNTSNISTDKQYPKLSKASSGYLEIEHFKNADLHTGYFCYNCTYFIKPNHCAIVEDSGPDVYNKESGVIAPYGLCTLWDPNEEETR
jgi:hypothetical protein